MKEVKFRKFEEKDQAGVADLYASGMHGYAHIPFVGQSYAWYIERRLRPDGDMRNVQSVYMDAGGKSCFWVAEYEDRIVGCIGAVPSTSEKYGSGFVELVRMIVSAECRKMAIGSRLVAVMESWAIEEGYRGVYLLTFGALPEPAILYPKCGYSLIEEVDFDVADKLELQQPTYIKVTHYTKQLRS